MRVAVTTVAAMVAQQAAVVGPRVAEQMATMAVVARAPVAREVEGGTEVAQQGKVEVVQGMDMAVGLAAAVTEVAAAAEQEVGVVGAAAGAAGREAEAAAKG